MSVEAHLQPGQTLVLPEGEERAVPGDDIEFIPLPG
jgi:hypothetical protein